MQYKKSKSLTIQLNKITEILKFSWILLKKDICEFMEYLQ